jgi:hypothetical protein
MVVAVGNLVGFIGAAILLYGLFELNKFVGVGLLLVALAQSSLRYVKK